MTTAIPPMEVKLAGEVVSLELSMKACRRVSNYFGGLIPANTALMNIDAEAMRKILAAGLDKTLSDTDGLDAAIYQTGALQVSEFLKEYLDKLATGGRGSPTDDGKAKG